MREKIEHLVEGFVKEYSVRNRTSTEWESPLHLARIAGLGTFGLNRMLITEKGCCGRLGSLVTNASIEPTPRPEKEYCLFKHDVTEILV